MIRLPSDVVLSLRRRAATSGLSLGEAARQLMLGKSLGRRHGLIEHLAWVHDRLLRDHEELEGILALGARDTSRIGEAIDALGRLRAEWTRTGDEDDDDDMLLYYQQGGFQ